MSTSKESRSSTPVLLRLNKVVFGLAALILLAMVALAYREWRHYNMALVSGLRLLSIQSSIENLVSNLLEAETGQRAFLLKGEDRYLEPYNRALPIAIVELTNLGQLLSPPGHAPDPQIVQLNSLVNREMTELRQSIERRRKGSAASATELLPNEPGKTTLDEIRSLCFAIFREAASRRSDVQVRALGAARGALLVTTFGSVFLMGLLLVGYRAIQKGMLARERDAADMRSLHELRLRLMHQSDLNSVLSDILYAAKNITGADMGNIQLVDDKGFLRIEAQHGFSDGFLDFFKSVEGQEAACGTALARRERVVVEDVERSPIFAGKPILKVMLDAGARAVQSTPLIGQTGVTVGMLSTHYRQPRQPGERDLRLIDLLAREAADLIEKIRAEEALRRSEERYRATFDNAAVGIAHVGLDGRWLRFNDAVCGITGYTREELTGKTFEDITHPDDLAANWVLAHRTAAGEIPAYSIEKRYLRKDGSVVWVNVTVSLLRDPSGAPRHYISVIEDIDDRKRAEEGLRATEQQLLSIVDNMSAAVNRCSRDFRYVWVSRSYADWIGRPVEDFAGRHLRDVIGAEGYAQFRPYMERALAGERVESSIKVKLMGHRERWVHAVYVPMYSQGEIDGWIAVITDITDILQAQEQLREANQGLARANDDLERFAFAASHDLQEPLRMITAYSQLLMKRYPDRFDGDARMFVNTIVDGTERMRDLLADLLAYTEAGSRVEEITEIVDLNAIVDGVKKNLQASIAETGAIVVSDDLPPVRAHAAHFTSLLQNLIGNAIKYRSEQVPRIHISAQKVNGDIRFAVADNGIGIDPKYQGQIFEVFKRLHARNIPGTGVGLAICKRVVERYGGRIWVESTPGQGATFFFTVPAIAERALAADQSDGRYISN